MSKRLSPRSYSGSTIFPRISVDRLNPSWQKFWASTRAGEEPMKKFALAIALVVTSLSLAGCFVGKGKAPPPVVTKG